VKCCRSTEEVLVETGDLNFFLGTEGPMWLLELSFVGLICDVDVLSSREQNNLALKVY
jgi:hypothetical protein